MLAHAFNSSGASLAVVVDAGVGQPVLTGGFLIKQFGFRFGRGSVVDSTYDFVSQGAVSLS
ncbi:hypothetical protein CCB80_10415 [Armatimonadetes bacterium Uphvl-Ar1]|nr:hypothetical protein CCB80_10415 [Armatimonadetes bacterium Uphvl-Ar1]